MDTEHQMFDSYDETESEFDSAEVGAGRYERAGISSAQQQSKE